MLDIYKKIIPIIVLATGLSVIAQGALAQSTAIVPQSDQQVRLSYAPLVTAVAPAVVNIYTRKTVEAKGFQSPLFSDPFFQRFFGNAFPGTTQRRQENSLGSGVIVSPTGLVVTNHHVIADADDIQVILRDRREFKAKVLVSDERTDLSVLQLQDVKGELPVVTLGDSDDVQVGDLVLAIGNPFGVGQTVTSGIVSGLARTSVDISDYQSFIQTDAAINPGNSGGALVAMDGSIIGINTAIFSKSGGSQGIGFAIPSSMVKAILNSATTGTPLLRPWLGFDSKVVDWDIANALGMDVPHGLIVEHVRANGPAAKAGIKPGDIILSADGKIVEDAQNLRFRAATKGVGQTVKLAFLRDGKPLEADFVLEAPPEDPPRDPVIVRKDAPFAGAVFVNLSPALTEELNLRLDRSGVMVMEIARGSPAARMGLRPGDLLKSINDYGIKLTADLRDVLSDPPKTWRIVIDRNGETRTVEVR
ncbi:MAG: Do family serine endopeptidase [Alphaproteobacteria bacterium]|nr:Do family serine endopeptidase [Alphaproteobacteria bacterium]